MNTAVLKTLVIYAIILPLAVMLGWMTVDLANWDQTSFVVFVGLGFVLLLPLILKWHYAALVLSWGTYITIFFLPGQPPMWMLMAGLNVAIAVLNRIIQKQTAFLSAPSITTSLLIFAFIVVLTANLRGGFGINAFGSASFGGKAYYFILAAVAGYFAFASYRIPPEHAKFYVGIFFISGMVSGVSNLIYLAGPAFYFLFLLFPVGFAAVQAASEQGGTIARIAGFGAAGVAFGFYLLAMHGVRGVLRKWWRALLLLTVLIVGSMSGYRSTVVLFGMVFVVMFITEGLLRSPIFPGLLLVGGLAFVLILPFSTRLPMSIQRSFSFLPMEVAPMVRIDAQSSIEWRVAMWRTLVPDLPKYLWLGKGYAQNPTDLYLTQQAVLRGRAPGYAGAILSGDYHSGPLSVYIPFGSFGALAFLIFMGCCIRALYLNLRYGRDDLRTYNRFLFAYFCGRLIFFFSAFGALSYDFYIFTGTMGLSVALNGGICRKPALVPQPVRFRGNLAVRTPQPGPA